MNYNQKITFKLDEKLYDILKLDAKKTGVPLGTFIRIKLKEIYSEE